MEIIQLSLASVLTSRNGYVKSKSSSELIKFSEATNIISITNDAGFYIKLRAVYEGTVYESLENEYISVPTSINEQFEENLITVYSRFDPKITVKKIKKLLTSEHCKNQSIGFSSEQKSKASAPSVKTFLSLLAANNPKASLDLVFGSFAAGDIDSCSVFTTAPSDTNKNYIFLARFRSSQNIDCLGLKINYHIAMDDPDTADPEEYVYDNTIRRIDPDVLKRIAVIILMTLIAVAAIILIVKLCSVKKHDTIDTGVYPVSIYVNFEGSKVQEILFWEYTLYIDDIPYGELEIDSTSYITLDLKAGEHTVCVKHKSVKSKEYTIKVDSSTEKVVFDLKVGFIAPSLKKVS